MKTGDKIKVIFYGEEKAGVIDRVGKSGKIVFVRMNDSGKVQWFHAESVEVQS